MVLAGSDGEIDTDAAIPVSDPYKFDGSDRITCAAANGVTNVESRQLKGANYFMFGRLKAA
jgi:hypothetical protein